MYAIRSYYVLGGDLLLQQHQPLDEGFGTWGTAGNVDVDGDDLVDPLDDAVRNNFV